MPFLKQVLVRLLVYWTPSGPRYVVCLLIACLLTEIEKIDFQHSLKSPASYIDNSLKLKEKINDIKIPSDFDIISLDVVSLFTNVPKNLVVQSIEKRWTQLHNKINMSCTEFIEVIKFILNNNFFQFNKKFYKQTFGSAMGNPLSPILSDIVMEDLEIECIKKLNVKPLFYFRYVDDILLCVPSNSIDHTLNTFNTYDKNLQFTVEIAQNKSISFLDLKIIIDQHRHIITNWYRKPTFSGRYLNYNSHHPLSNKIAIIYCLVDRAINLSHSSFHNDNILFIKNVLKLNDYPKKVIDFHLKKRLKNLTFSNSRKTKTFNNKAIISLPYVKELELFNHHFFTQVSTKVVYSTKNKLSSIIKLGKDKTDKVNQANVVYKINCKDCNASYVGQTSRRLQVRAKEHAKKYKDKDQNSGLFMHTHDNNHTIDFQNIKILDNDINNGKNFFLKLFLYIHKRIL